MAKQSRPIVGASWLTRTDFMYIPSTTVKSSWLSSSIFGDQEITWHIHEHGKRVVGLDGPQTAHCAAGPVL